MIYRKQFLIVVFIASRVLASDSVSSPQSLYDKAKKWVTSDSNLKNKAVEVECDVEKTKDNFISSCVAAKYYSAKTNDAKPDLEYYRKLCKCVAVNFAVEKIGKATNCSFDNFQVVYTILNHENAKSRCN